MLQDPYMGKEFGFRLRRLLLEGSRIRIRLLKINTSLYTISLAAMINAICDYSTRITVLRF
jgi:hypothetical protein